ncbi:hypothetical protein VTK73DRAFT_6530 [Phialemonium thermophilum]|uniref:Ribophorin II C-terminal domain-containing protein n=1 Tax=Phialemonium thermophilum TaxID=223376 RepID=A0ABR3XWD0_9PEZI
MRFSTSIFSALALLAAGTAQAASSWSFDQGSVVVTAKKGNAEEQRESLNPKKVLAKPIVLGSADTIKIGLTAKDNGKAKRPHQAFLILKETESGLEAPFPLSVKENGQGTVQISQKDLPVQLLRATKPLEASLILASFGSAQGLDTRLFDLEIKPDLNSPAPSYEPPLRYGKKPEIRHIFRADPCSPPKVVSLFFTLAVLATLPVLFGVWLFLGANLDHLSKAIGQAPLSYAAFLGSIFAMEFVFFLYYSTWNLFQVLPLIGVVGAVMGLSGTKALGEVQNRRLAGEL